MMGLGTGMLHEALSNALSRQGQGDAFNLTIHVSDQHTWARWGSLEEPAAGVDEQDSDEASVTELYGFRYELGAEVVLETSREAFEARARQEREDAEAEQALKRNGSSTTRMIAGTPSALAFHGPIEQGVVIGRAQYQDRADLYLVRYRAGDGRQVEDWWGEDAIFQPDEEVDIGEPRP